MSIVPIDDVLFNDNSEEREIRYDNCIFFLILNGTSIFFGLFYLYIFFMIPKYYNSSNNIPLFFSLFHLASNCLYFLIFFELYLYEPITLSISIKIITMFNPLIILCIYYWSACLTHNLYNIYYGNEHNMDKRFNTYKYILFILMIIFYIYTLLNINFNDSRISSKSFSFISNYNDSFIEVFYIFGFCIIIYILYQLYYVINKKPDFIVMEYQEPEELAEEKKKYFKSLVTRNIIYVSYFLLTFIPPNIIMLLKYVFNSNIKSYYIDVLVISLISFFGTFLFIIKLFDSLMYNLIINLLTFNRVYVYNIDSNNRNLQNTTTPFLAGNIEEVNRRNNKTNTAVYTNKIDFKNYINKNGSFSPRIETSLLPKSLGETRNYSEIVQNEKFEGEIKYKEMKSFNYIETKNSPKFIKETNEDIDSDNNDSLRLESYNNSKFGGNKSRNQDAILVENDNSENYSYNNKNNNCEDKKTNISSFNPSFSSLANRQLSMINKNVDDNKRYNTICLNQKFTKKIGSQIKVLKTINKNQIYKSFRGKDKLNNLKSSSSVRSNSITNAFNPKGGPYLGLHKSPKSNTKIRIDLSKDEIYNFASMNYHVEINENLLRMIAVSVSINECRLYDDLDIYKEYYKSTIPWKNKNFYTEKTQNKKYNDNNLPSWLSIKNDKRFTNIEFKIMAYCPFVFHHIRLMDKVSIDDVLASLDPNKNILKLKNMKVLGGRGNNSLFCTWDKKLILKTIDTSEKNILFDKMIIDYHCFMRESNSLLSRIYGLYKIELIDKGSVYVIVQRNMDDLPFETKLITFDFKGSTVDRQIIAKEDLALIREKLWEKYKNKVLKDMDLDIIGLKFILERVDRDKIISFINSDSSFLQNLEVTDYSLVVFVHKYREEDLEKNKKCKRIIRDKNRKYIFNFSIVDYLGTYNFMKKLEKKTKNFISVLKKSKDTNFSVSDPENYGKRFRKFTKTIIVD